MIKKTFRWAVLAGLLFFSNRASATPDLAIRIDEGSLTQAFSALVESNALSMGQLSGNPYWFVSVVDLRPVDVQPGGFVDIQLGDNSIWGVHGKGTLNVGWQITLSAEMYLSVRVRLQVVGVQHSGNAGYSLVLKPVSARTIRADCASGLICSFLNVIGGVNGQNLDNLLHLALPRQIEVNLGSQLLSNLDGGYLTNGGAPTFIATDNDWIYVGFDQTQPSGAPLVPVLFSPPDLATANQDFGVLLSWSPKPQTRYDLQVARDVAFTTDLVQFSDLTSGAQAVSGLSDSTEYFWRVRARNSLGESPWSVAWRVRTECSGRCTDNCRATCETPPVATAPVNVTVPVIDYQPGFRNVRGEWIPPSTRVDFAWTRGSVAASSYEIEITGPQGYSTMASGATFHQGRVSVCSSYSWRVRRYPNIQGQGGPWSAPARFSTPGPGAGSNKVITDSCVAPRVD